MSGTLAKALIRVITKSIFDRYFRVPGTKVQGSGLGLSISKGFCGSSWRYADGRGANWGKGVGL